MQNRQADAALLNETDPAALPFRSHQDALDFASHGAEHANRILAANNLVNVVERYRKGDIELKLALDLIGVRGARKYHLVFFAVPMGIEQQSTNAAIMRAGSTAGFFKAVARSNRSRPFLR